MSYHRFILGVLSSIHGEYEERYRVERARRGKEAVVSSVVKDLALNGR